MAWLIVVQMLAVTGALAVYLLLPKGEAARGSPPGVFIGLLVTAALLGLLPTFFGSMGQMREAYFFIFALTAILSAVRVITHRRPVYSALYFVLTVLASAGMLLLVNAQFLGIANIIIYAGAILVTYVFVIMLAMQSGAPEYDHTSREPLAASVAGLMFAGLVLGLVGMDAKPLTGNGLATAAPAAATQPTISATAPGSPVPLTNLQSVGLALLGDYAVSLEVAGLLLLVAMVGGLAIARRRTTSDVEEVG